MKTLALVTAPTAAEEVRQSVIEVLKEMLTLAEEGHVDGVAVILSHIDGTWTDRGSETMEFSKMIGRFEIMKHRWITQHLERETDG